MNFPTGFSSVTNLITMITPWPIGSPLWIKVLRIWSLGGQGWSVIARKGLWWVVILHHDLLSTLFLSDLRTHISQWWELLSDGSCLVLRILPRTSSRFLLSPAKNGKILSFSTVFWYLMLSLVQSHSNSLYTSNFCQYRERMLKY